MRLDAADALVIAGALALVWGLYLWAPIAAWIGGGLLMIAAGVMLACWRARRD